MNKTIRYLLSKPGKSQALVQLREGLLKMMLVSSFVVGTVLFGFASIPAFQKRLYQTILIYGILYVLTILITFVKRFPYRVRAIGWLGMLYIFGSINLYLNGLNVDAGLFFITFIAMAILLMDLAGGIGGAYTWLLDCFRIGIYECYRTLPNTHGIAPIRSPGLDNWRNDFPFDGDPADLFPDYSGHRVGGKPGENHPAGE